METKDKKRFWIFAGEHYYPAGGMNDFQDSCDTYDEAVAWWSGFSSKDYGGMWCHIYDSVENTIVFNS